MRLRAAFAESVASVRSSSTLLPFLYETRSLCYPRFPKSIGFSTRSPAYKYIRSSARRTRKSHSPGQTKDSDPINFEEQTTAGLLSSSDNVSRWRGLLQKDKSHDLWTKSSTESSHHKTDDIVFSDRIEGRGKPDESVKTDSDPISFSFDSNPRMGESTITPKERQTFLRIFSDIRTRSKRKSDTLSARQGLFVTPEVATRRDIAEKKMLSIMDRVGLKSEQIPEEGKLRAIESFPQVLRGAAAEAFGLSDVKESDENIEVESMAPERNTRTAMLNEKRTAEYERVKTKMCAASSDVELWDIMEHEVFSLVTRLGFGKSKSKTRRHQEMPQPPGEDIEIYGPLYPSFLLLGFRLLERTFAKPSPLVDNVLPRIKSMGLMSHVLGASTALYNEHLRVLWYRNDDFLGALSLLSEMEQAGLDFDNETLQIVNDINSAQILVTRGANGTLLRSLWTMPEFAYGSFRQWSQKIQHSLDLRQREYSET